MKLCVRLDVVVAAAAAFACMLARPSPAAAGLTVCNKSTYGTVNLAVAVSWLDNGNPYEQAQGWTVLTQGNCKEVIHDDPGPYTIFIYAYANKDPQKLVWGGNNSFCLESMNFLYKAGEEKLPCRHGKSYGMRHIDTGDSHNYTYNLYD
jgi:uncharacterized membrane protein